MRLHAVKMLVRSYCRYLHFLPALRDILLMGNFHKHEVTYIGNGVSKPTQAVLGGTVAAVCLW